MTELNRRSFLRMGAAFGVGLAIGEVMLPVKIKTNEVVRKATGQRTGNADAYQMIEEACKNADNIQECFQAYEPPTLTKIEGTTIAPLMEEVAFRGIPSTIVSEMEGSKKPYIEMLLGTGGFGMSRRELLAGLITTLAFAFNHNLTRNGIDTRTIPASHIQGGMVYWYLQRKLGIVANTTAHAWHNFRALT